jgi:hypothetical protein
MVLLNPLRSSYLQNFVNIMGIHALLEAVFIPLMSARHHELGYPPQTRQSLLHANFLEGALAIQDAVGNRDVHASFHLLLVS